ncbi:hypothetical protein AAFC00_003926 [Neodothiora populina]|uniref:Aldehyde dehydrogenase domain-containing protein n=1 Tax=Neodothiora populina TaxID=2781224 RepID=A0ABR3PFU0_9PEZI
MAGQQIENIRAAAVDGRTRNVIYRRSQLGKLQAALSQEAETMISAIAQDTGCTMLESRVEYYLTMLQVKDRYLELDPAGELVMEYSIAEGRDASESREGVGIVLISAVVDHSPFFSVVAPLSAAIAAGNCVILQVENTVRSLPNALRKALRVLDNDTFGIIQQPLADADKSAISLEVVQSSQVTSNSRTDQIVSGQNRRTVAVVDRTADMEKAAEALLFARFGYCGQSPYAPDIVLVNEFIKEDFLQTLVKKYSHLDQDPMPGYQKSEKSGSKDTKLEKSIADLQRNGNVKLVNQAARGAILDIKNRGSQTFLKKIRAPCMVVHGFKSLDDAIDVLNSDGQENLAAYHWGSAGQCRYLSQFISARVTFVNHIPADLLVGPAFPDNAMIDASVRFPTSLFSKPTPAFVTQSTRATVVADALMAPSTSERRLLLERLRDEAMKELPDYKRKQKSRAAFGFFEQAMLINLGLVLLSTVTVVSGGVYGFKHGWLRR